MFKNSFNPHRNSRFTEDIFAFLISLIFISEPITATINVYRAHPLLTGLDYCGAVNSTDSTGSGAGVAVINGTGKRLLLKFF